MAIRTPYGKISWDVRGAEPTKKFRGGEVRMISTATVKCNILEVFFVKKDCIGDELVLISGELAAY